MKNKAMLLPQQHDDILNVSPSSKSEVSFFGVLQIQSGSEIYILTEWRYCGKVIDFIDGILLDRPDSYNPVLVHCLC